MVVKSIAEVPQGHKPKPYIPFLFEIVNPSRILLKRTWFTPATRASRQHFFEIESLKRLQREAFFDLMKLRERQEKVERLLSFHQSVKGGPFQEARTHMKGIVNVDGALLFQEDDYQQASNKLDLVGAKSGIDLKFILETQVRQRDLLVAEFLACHRNLVGQRNMYAIPLALSKLAYLTYISEWLSAVFVPFGAQSTDFGAPRFPQGRYNNRSSSFCLPLFHQPQNCGIGFNIQESNFSASLAGLVSLPGSEPSFAPSLPLSTFWQVSYKPFEEARLTLSGIWKTIKSSPLFKVNPFAIPRGSIERQTVKERSSVAPTKVADRIAEASVAMMLEAEFDERMNLECWVEMWKSRPSLLKWGVSLSDAPVDELGWGLKVGGQMDGGLHQFWMEGSLNFNLGKKAVIQPGVIYAVNGESRTPAVILRTSWFM